jgi:hypothetical protein
MMGQRLDMERSMNAEYSGAVLIFLWLNILVGEVGIEPTNMKL